MRSACLALLFVTIIVARAAADTGTYHAGFVRVTIQDAEPFDVSVWYPANVAEAPFQAGPFTIAATLSARIAEGERFPVVLLSHGRRGSPLAHRELAAQLARGGFIVIAPRHSGDASGETRRRPQLKILAGRSRQAKLALDNILADKRFSRSADETRIAAIGYSAGGFTVLSLAGAQPDFARAEIYCKEHPDDRGSCGAATADGGAVPGTEAAKIAEWPSFRDPRVRALVLLDPLAFMFDSKGLEAVQMPTLLLRPESGDYLRGEGNALALATALPNPARQIVVPGSHFVFIDPCPAEAANTAAAQCQDAPGIDRAAIHRKIETEIVNFLRQAM
jgi:predicted dienelactone hydrolase